MSGIDGNEARFMPVMGNEDMHDWQRQSLKDNPVCRFAEGEYCNWQDSKGIIVSKFGKNNII